MPSATDEEPKQGQQVAQLIKIARGAAKMTLRQVEEATDGHVSNAYLSQIETGRVGRPSAQILHALSEVLPVTYELLMKAAGYLQPGTGTAATFADSELTDEEHAELLQYLAFIRQRQI